MEFESLLKTIKIIYKIKYNKIQLRTPAAFLMYILLMILLVDYAVNCAYKD